MFGKIKQLVADVTTIYGYIEAHKSQIAQLQKDLAATQKAVKALVPTTVKKTK
jgi:peptidoglycan hydrolase CwlO-like protein